MTIMKLNYKRITAGIAAGMFLMTTAVTAVQAQESPKEEDFFRIARISSPEGTLLEVGGLCTLPNGDLGVATRRGDIFIVENPTSKQPYFRKVASGLHEVLGLAYKNGSLYCAQRGELTKMTDTNMDGKMDLFETVYAWPLSGHYHEYSFGPVLGPDGSFFVSGNVAFGDEEWWRGESRVPMRGWMMHITDDGKMEPWATGFRSPCGLGTIDGELFYTENQGDWIGSGGLTHVKKGSFVGHPAGLRWTGMPNSPVKLTTEELYSKVDPRYRKDANGRAIKPENVENEKFVTLFDMKKYFPEVQLPAVWLPHGVLGVSNSQLTTIPEGAFGPFAKQVLIGDQGQSKIMRVYLEKVNGEYQGAAWDFRSGFQSGVLRLAWGKDGSLFVGETNRGWGSAGDANQGLQRLVWNNRVPFEMRTVSAMPDGFEITFTQPVDKKYAEDIASYNVESFIYKYHPVYGSPTVNTEKLAVKGIQVAADGMKVRIIVDGLRRYYIHKLSLNGIRAADHSYSLVHSDVYYTLNNIPEGDKLALSAVSIKNTAAKPAVTAPAKVGTKPAAGKALTYEQVKPLLNKYTCSSCHNPDKKQVGPGFKDVAKRNYSVAKILALLKNPKPENWPGYATPMPPFPQVPQADAVKIATWINSLK
ncbi:cytochrome c551/c552 [Chitinophaga niastensis]|uniref:Cytochrome c551/c552 n=2 Tax=Chitinophaga niastensis TaxID=536980 RepID=A0A2P8HF60_CHINA|nr:cytochrome c551/c552 [Chitinophaga niastensis]